MATTRFRGPPPLAPWSSREDIERAIRYWSPVVAKSLGMEELPYKDIAWRVYYKRWPEPLPGTAQGATERVSGSIAFRGQFTRTHVLVHELAHSYLRGRHLSPSLRPPFVGPTQTQENSWVHESIADYVALKLGEHNNDDLLNTWTPKAITAGYEPGARFIEWTEELMPGSFGRLIGLVRLGVDPVQAIYKATGQHPAILAQLYKRKPFLPREVDRQVPANLGRVRGGKPPRQEPDPVGVTTPTEMAAAQPTYQPPVSPHTAPPRTRPGTMPDPRQR